MIGLGAVRVGRSTASAAMSLDTIHAVAKDNRERRDRYRPTRTAPRPIIRRFGPSMTVVGPGRAWPRTWARPEGSLWVPARRASRLSLFRPEV